MGYDMLELLGKIVAVLIAVSLLIVGCVFAGNVLNKINELHEDITTQTVQLKSVEYENALDGQFILGCGSVNSESCYICYEILEDGGIKLLKLNAAKTTIYETLSENEMAYAEIDVNGFGEKKEIRLFLPKNTIQVEYNMSLGDEK